MEKKQQMELLIAVAGVVALLYMRKNQDAATLAGAAGLVTAASQNANAGWASQPIVLDASPYPVVDGAATNPPAAAAAPATPAPASLAVFGGTSGAASLPNGQGVLSDTGYGHQNAAGDWVWPDGTVSKRVAFTGAQSVAIAG